MIKKKESKKTKEFYVSYPNLGFEIKKSKRSLKWAVVARYKINEFSWSEWYVAKWFDDIEAASNYADFLENDNFQVLANKTIFQVLMKPVEEFK